jgi:hypothetical protein
MIEEIMSLRTAGSHSWREAESTVKARERRKNFMAGQSRMCIQRSHKGHFGHD